MAKALLRLIRKTYTIYSKYMKNGNIMPKKRPRRKIILFYSLLLFLIGVSAVILNQNTSRQTQKSSAAGGDCSVTTTQLQISAKEQELFDLVNNYRASKNLPKLVWDPTLNKAASWLSADMLKNKRMNHLDSLNRNIEQRLPDCGYVNPIYGENIASGENIAANIFTIWKSSPTHNENMLNSKFTVGAVSLESDATNTANYWTFVFGNNIVTLSPTLGQSAPTTPPNTSPFPTTRLAVSPTSSPYFPTINPQNTGVPMAEPTQVIEITPTAAPITPNMQIKVKVKIQGIGKGGNMTPKHLTRKVTAVIYSSGEAPVAQGSGYLTYDNEQFFNGVINLGRMQQGIYFVKLKSYGTLLTMVQPEFQHLNIGPVNEIPTVTLVQGDVNDDNVISLADYNLSLTCFQDKWCPVKEVIDLNDDGTTDVIDYNLLLQSFMQQRGQ